MATRYADVEVVSPKIVWDPKTVEIKTLSVEKTLAPLVQQVTTLVNHSKKKHGSGKSKKAPRLAKEIDLAITRLVKVGEEIAVDFQEIKEPMLEACKEASAAGDVMRASSREFAADPITAPKRNSMIRASRALLSSVTRLLCVADMADVYRLLTTLKLVDKRLKELEKAQTSADLVQSFKNYGDDLIKLARLAGIRQADLKDLRHREEMAAAQATLRKSSRMLLTASKARLKHPEVESAYNNKELVFKEVKHALSKIADTAQAVGRGERHPFEEIGFLANALDELMAQLDQEPEEFYDRKVQSTLQTLVDDIVGGASKLAETVCTRDVTREKIFTECKNVKSSLSTLLEECNEENKDNPEEIDAAIGTVENDVKDLSKQLRKSVADHLSDSFMDASSPLTLLIEAAETGDQKKIKEYSDRFSKHARKLSEVSTLACTLSDNAEGVKMARIAARQLDLFYPQVLSAATTLGARPHSKVAQENMDTFRDVWEEQVRLLTEAVDDITTVDDFLIVSEGHILEDINLCVKAVDERDVEALDLKAGAVRSRITRVREVVSAEMENYESGPFTEAVNRSVHIMTNNIMPQFVEYVEYLIEALSQATLVTDTDKNSFIDAVRLVYEGMRDIRKSVAMRKPSSDSESESEDDWDHEETLLSKMADALAKRKEKFAYQQLKAGGKVQFELHSEGRDDPGCQGIASIVVNGVEHCPKKQGHNVVVLDKVGDVISTKAFDTAEHREGAAMSKYLEDIPEDHVALIAVQGTSGEGVSAANSALKRLGAVEPINPGHGCSWAFAGYKGNHRDKSWVSQIYRPRYQGPAMISDTINTPAADMGKILVEINSEGAEDEPYLRNASIKVNGIERCPVGRGMNIVLLDNAGNYLMSKNFDTADPQIGPSEGYKMKLFLDNLPNGRIVCLSSLENVGDGMKEIVPALLNIGAELPLNPSENGSLALLGYTGPKGADWVKQVISKRGEGPSKIVEFFITPAAEEEVNEGHEVLSDYETINMDDLTRDSQTDNKHTAIKRSARSVMRALPEEEKAKINKLAEGLTVEKNRLITEVNKWDEQGNDIIVLAKRMCMVMMDMSDFARGSGPLKTTMDVVRAAEKIAKYGAQMNKLASEIAEMCPHSHTRSDLLAYLQRIALYSHQLTITARVKSDVHMISGEVIMSGAENATSLIEAAKNLMNAVILTLKASYIASTKHRTDGLQVVSWRMRAPEKKPLFKVDTLNKTRPIRATDFDVASSPTEGLNDFL
ncbi:catenin alpha-2-like isoform X2 [Hydractinia symbiolongicarpus]|uniref:catenin alpha-2-like isoform X2 n=1 Tax=Hydractinia symbiolongicarpus TaxID=13093 RepID=UPI00254F8847|nr:catenin alpha-2-like isoform X2 [Hydractinia symbiolongicarpus]